MMLRRSLHVDPSRRVLLISAHDTIIRFFSSEKTKDAFELNTMTRPDSESIAAAQQADDETSLNDRYRQDASTEFVPFFKQVDNFDSKTSFSSFFESLRDASPARPKQNTPPPSTYKEMSMTSPLEGKSIFDAFPIPDTPLVTNTNTYDEESYRQYREIIDEVLSSDRFRRVHTRRPFTDEFIEPIKSWLQATEPQVRYNLPMLRTSVEQGYTSKLGHVEVKDTAESFRNELNAQREVFLKKVPLTAKQYQEASAALQQLGNFCAKRAKSLPLDIAWEKIKEAGIRLNTLALNSYLYSCTLYVSRRKGGLLSSLTGDSILDIIGSTPATARESVQDESDQEYHVNLPEEVATFHDLLYEPTEQSLTLRIKALVTKGNASGAEALLDSFVTKKDEARHRTYLPVLRCYLEQGDMGSALRLLKQMRDTPTCILESETYIQLLSFMAERGFFRNDSEPIEGAEDLGYASSGPKLFDQLVSDMAEDVLEITSASARRLYSAFESSSGKEDGDKEASGMHPLAPLPIESEMAAPDELIVSRTVISDETGVCPRSGAKLRLFMLEPDEREQMRKTLLKLAETAYTELQEKFGKQGGDNSFVALAEFADWLDTREGEPFTAILDGPNLAYYMQNFEQGKFNIYQVDFMLKALENMGEVPLVIMPQKYCLPYFTISRTQGTRQHFDKNEIAILESILSEGKLYRVPPGCLDDYYWMLASVSDQKAARGDRNMDVEPDDGSGRWPGTRPMLVSNDQMRDHKLELLEPRLFRRWYSSHMVNYSFSAFIDDECVDREISFSMADFFSREIQGNPTSNADGIDCGMAWHFPVRDWDTHERLCIRLPRET